jgi:Protein of unknown function (DUF2934)
VDIDTRRKKQQTLMVQLVERKVRSRAQQIYETHGQSEGQELEHWFQAESEVLENSILAPLYRRMKSAGNDAVEAMSAPLSTQDSSCCESAS